MSKLETRSMNFGDGFLGLLTILFIGLKLTGHIDWPWLWVFSPIWIPLVLGLVIILLVLIWTR